MKKKFIIVIILCIFFTTGCSISIAKVNDREYIINNLLLEDSKLKNTGYKGYEIYVPNTLKIINKSEYNTIFKDEYNNDYYMYVDAVSYLNKIENTYNEDKDSYYSKKLKSKNGKKNGYIEINKINKKYFVEAVYNYGKIEVYTDKKDLNIVLTNISQVLSSLRYKNKVLEALVGDNVLNYKEESFNIFTTKKNTTNYLDYIKKYDQEYDVKLADADQDKMTNDNK